MSSFRLYLGLYCTVLCNYTSIRCTGKTEELVLTVEYVSINSTAKTSFVVTDMSKCRGRPTLRKDVIVSSPRGYQFVDAPHERYICKVCIHPCQDPYLSGCCGHNFCKSCLDDVKKTSTTCPVCQNENFTAFANKQADREFRSLHVMCTNKGRGCEWQGELNDINSHLGNSDGCHFENVKCSNECGKVLQRRYLTNHVETGCPHRTVKCRFCDNVGGRRFVEGEHKKDCLKLPILCPNKCQARKIARDEMEAHRKECPLEVVQCEYHNVGCEEKVTRKRKREHEKEKMEEHLLMTKHKLAEEAEFSRVKLASSEAKLAATETRLCNVEVILHRLINGPGYSAVQTDSTQWPFHLPSTATTVTKICPVIMKMSSFAEKVYWDSEPFFSHNIGYKMSLSVLPPGVGDGKGTHMSVYLNLMKGPHDDELTWPMRGKFEVRLLNQISDCEHHCVTVNFCSNIPCGAAGKVIDSGKALRREKSKFISSENLHKVTPTCQYLKDDCIFLQVSKLL